MTAPVGSVTVPTIDPKSACACARGSRELERMRNRKRRRELTSEGKNGLASQEAGKPHTSGFMTQRLQ
jgi:hypothetical protein